MNLGESYSVRFRLSMDFGRRINPFRQQASADRANGGGSRTLPFFSFGRMDIQTKIARNDTSIHGKRMKQGVSCYARVPSRGISDARSPCTRMRPTTVPAAFPADERDATEFFARGSPPGRFGTGKGGERTPSAPRARRRRGAESPVRDAPSGPERDSNSRPFAMSPRGSGERKRRRPHAAAVVYRTAAGMLSGLRSRPVPRRRWRPEAGPARHGR